MSDEPIDDFVLEKLYDISKNAVTRTFQHIQELQVKAFCILLSQLLFLGFYVVSINIQFTLNILPDPILGGIAALSFTALVFGMLHSIDVLRIVIYQEIDIEKTILLAIDFPEKNVFIKPIMGEWSKLQDTNLKITEIKTNSIKWAIRGLILSIILGVFETVIFVCI